MQHLPGLRSGVRCKQERVILSPFAATRYLDEYTSPDCLCSALKIVVPVQYFNANKKTLTYLHKILQSCFVNLPLYLQSKATSQNSTENICHVEATN